MNTTKFSGQKNHAAGEFDTGVPFMMEKHISFQTGRRKRVGLNCTMDHYRSNPDTFLERKLQNISVTRMKTNEMTGKNPDSEHVNDE